jgi:predicted CXXCH cytochrome family protein
MFNDECAHCHRDSFRTAEKLLEPDATGAVVPDGACSKCHAGPLHNLFTKKTIACATCHREHRGRMQLARVPDGQCISCHADLKEHRIGGGRGLQYRDVRAFAGGHPAFREQDDPGRLHFNHRAHLRADGILGRDGRTVKLQCVDCHRPDSGGHFMEPIRYEKHCADCHPLCVRLVGDFKGPDQQRLDQAVKDFNARPAPHQEPTHVRAVLRERLLAFVQEFPVLAGDPGERLVDPGSFRSPTGRPRPPTDVEWRWSREKLSTVENLMFPEQQKEISEKVLFDNAGGCRFCHLEKARDGGGLPVYEPTQIRERWMNHARFSHVKHRLLDCTECHDARQSSKTKDVLMPRLELCQRCHNPAVGVRHDCAECHAYHDRSKKHDLHKEMAIEGCIRR